LQACRSALDSSSSQIKSCALGPPGASAPSASARIPSTSSSIRSSAAGSLSARSRTPSISSPGSPLRLSLVSERAVGSRQRCLCAASARPSSRCCLVRSPIVMPNVLPIGVRRSSFVGWGCLGFDRTAHGRRTCSEQQRRCQRFEWWCEPTSCRRSCPGMNDNRSHGKAENGAGRNAVRTKSSRSPRTLRSIGSVYQRRRPDWWLRRNRAWSTMRGWVQKPGCC
jgi:hypothetical protein